MSIALTLTPVLEQLQKMIILLNDQRSSFAHTDSTQRSSFAHTDSTLTCNVLAEYAEYSTGKRHVPDTREKKRSTTGTLHIARLAANRLFTVLASARVPFVGPTAVLCFVDTVLAVLSRLVRSLWLCLCLISLGLFVSLSDQLFSLSGLSHFESLALLCEGSRNVHLDADEGEEIALVVQRRRQREHIPERSSVFLVIQKNDPDWLHILNCSGNLLYGVPVGIFALEKATVATPHLLLAVTG